MIYVVLIMHHISIIFKVLTPLLEYFKSFKSKHGIYLHSRKTSKHLVCFCGCYLSLKQNFAFDLCKGREMRITREVATDKLSDLHISFTHSRQSEHALTEVIYN